MKPVDQMTEAEIDAEIARRQAQQPQQMQKSKPVEEMTEEEIDAELALKEKENPNAFMQAIEGIDRYTGAGPTRQFAYELAKGKGFGEASAQAGRQFMGDIGQAPTGKDIALELGASPEPLVVAEDIERPAEMIPRPSRQTYQPIGQEVETIKPLQEDAPLGPSAAGVAGLGLDIALDPLAFVPVTKVIKGGIKGATKIAKIAKRALKGSVEGIEAASGVKVLTNTGQALQDASSSLKKTLKPVRSKDFGKYKDIAVKNNIDPNLLPEAVEFGKDSTISRLARVQAEGPTGEKYLKKFEEGLDSVNDAVRTKIDSIAPPLSQADAGEHFRESYARGMENFFKDIDITNKEITRLAPNLKLTEKSQGMINSKLRGLEVYAKGALKRAPKAVQRSQAKELLNAVEAVRNTNGSYKQMYEQLQFLGDSFKKNYAGATVPTDVRRMRKLYGDIREAMDATVKSELGDNMYKSLKENNKAMAELFGEKSIISKVVENSDKAPETVFRDITSSTRKIDASKSILSPEDFNRVRTSFMDSLIKRNADGDIMFKSTIKSIRANNDKLVRMFSQTELEEIGELLTLGDAFGIPIMSTSGTGATNMFRDTFKSIPRSVMGENVIEGMKASARKAKPIKAPRAPRKPFSGIPYSREARKIGQVLAPQAQNESKRK